MLSVVKATATARRRRREQTEDEKELWRILQAGRPFGVFGK